MLQDIQLIKNMEAIKPWKFKNKQADVKIWIKRKRFRVIFDAALLSGGQYIDLMNFLKAPENTAQNLHNILAVLTMPMKFGLLKIKYDGRTHAARAKFLAENMSLAKAYPILLFFCKNYGNLTMLLADYLNKEIKQNTNQVQQQMTHIMNVMAGSSS